MPSHPAARTATIGIAVSSAERERVIAAARTAGTSRSQWMRAILISALDDPVPPTNSGTSTGSLNYGLTVHVTPSERDHIIARAGHQSPAAWARAHLLAHLHITRP
jgi:hypothetical protein